MSVRDRVWLGWWVCLLGVELGALVFARLTGQPIAAFLAGAGTMIAVMGLTHRWAMARRGTS